MRCKKRLQLFNETLEISGNGVRLRQMNITDHFKPVKNISFDMTGKIILNQNNGVDKDSSSNETQNMSEDLCIIDKNNILPIPSDLVAVEIGFSDNDDQLNEINDNKATKRKQIDNSPNICNPKSPRKDTTDRNTNAKNNADGAATPSTSKDTTPRKSTTGSPCQEDLNYDTIKIFKAKEGCQLQHRHLDELMKLFQRVTQNGHISKLLTNSEYEILHKFIGFEDSVKYAVMKLFMWKRMWYNIFSFCKKARIVVEDNKGITGIFEQLQQENFVETQYKPEEDFRTLLENLDQSQIKDLMTRLKIKPIKSKAHNIALIVQTSLKQKTLPWAKSMKDVIMQEVAKKMGFSFKISKEVDGTLFNICLLGTFINHGLTDLQTYFKAMIYDQTVFPEVQIEDYSVFNSRSEFLEYSEAIQDYTLLEKAIAAKKPKQEILKIGETVYDNLQKLPTVERDKLAPHLYRFRAEHMYSKALSMCCDKIFTKKDGYPDEVKKWLECLIRRFPHSRRIGMWYHKLIWLHMRHLNEINFEQAANLLIDVLGKKDDYNLNQASLYDLAKLGKSLKTNKVDALHHDQIAQLMPRLAKEKHIPREEINLSMKHFDQTEEKTLYINKSANEVTSRSVEQVALNYYSENGYPTGRHCESSIINALFMLFFWDIIYNPPKHIPGTFLGLIQDSPLDMFSEYFFPNRQALITKRIDEIESSWSDNETVNFPTENWLTHSHEYSAFGLINAIIHNASDVCDLVTVIGRKLLARIFSRLAEDMRTYRSGLPDLLVWNQETKKCRFIEVKSANDRLSTNQLMWLKYLKDNGADVAVCWVYLPFSKRKIFRSASSDDDN